MQCAGFDDMMGIRIDIWKALMSAAAIRTTVTLPAELIAAIDQAIREGVAKSRNEFLAGAVRKQLAEYCRAKIDAAFTGMASDPDYQQEAIEIAEEFAPLGLEALKHAEGRA